MHLRRAAQRVGVLHPGEAGGAVRLDDGEPASGGAEVRGRGGLSRMRAERLQVGGEHRVRAGEALDAHRRGEVGGGAAREVREREREHPEHAVGAVEERETLLLGEDERLMPAAASASSAA